METVPHDSTPQEGSLQRSRTHQKAMSREYLRIGRFAENNSAPRCQLGNGKKRGELFGKLHRGDRSMFVYVAVVLLFHIFEHSLWQMPSRNRDDSSPDHESLHPSQPKAPRKRPRSRVTTACSTCRGRRTKCDSQKPSCGYCRIRGFDCQYESTPAVPHSR